MSAARPFRRMFSPVRAAAALAACLMCAGLFAGPRGDERGGHAGDGTTAMSLQGALDRALEDERRAIALYEAVLARHGQRRPFSNVVNAERRHAAALIFQLERLGYPVPGGEVTVPPVPETFREACDMAEFAEIENIRLYDELIEAADDEEVAEVFRRLQAASRERHLPAFRRHSSGWHLVTIEDCSAVQRKQVEQAEVARNTLFASLLGRVVGEIRNAGPAGAIEVCKSEAPTLARAVATDHDLAIGRTSWKLRNPDNTGPGWLTVALEGRPETPRVLADRSGRLGYVSPIRVAATCLTCHGVESSIAPDVLGRLRALYPEDRATGFAAGDLRGWFWVQVPNRPETGS